MPNVTDPARELVGTLEKLQFSRPTIGYEFLAQQFNVEVWSKNYFRIIFCILDRIEEVEVQIQKLEMYDDEKSRALEHCRKIKPAFSQQSLGAPWSSSGFKHISNEHVSALRMLSAQIRLKFSYNAPSKEELDTIIVEATQLKEWLKQHQLHEKDFVRQALIVGLDDFLFRASRLTWLGQGYCMESLRDVITAYMALERGGIDPANQPDIQVALKKTGSFIESAYNKLSVVKGAVETSDWLLRIYGAAALSCDSGLSGLLTSQ